jgi:hypothetical protein
MNSCRSTLMDSNGKQDGQVLMGQKCALQTANGHKTSMMLNLWSHITHQMSILSSPPPWMKKQIMYSLYL